MAITDWGAVSDSGRQQRGITALCAAGAAAIVGLELMAPHQVTLGTLSLLPVVVACLSVRAAWAGWIVALAVAGRVLAAVVGDIDEELAGVESLAILGVGLTALWLGRGRLVPAGGAVVAAVAAAAPAEVVAAEAPAAGVATEAPVAVVGAAAPVARTAAPAAVVAAEAPVAVVGAAAPVAAVIDVPVARAVAPAWHALAGSLTRREREVIELAARGLTARRIALRLSISDRTVETHLARAYQKLGISSKQELVALTIESGNDPAGSGR